VTVSAAAVVLAAGAARRLGKPKQLLDWNGRPLLEWTVEAVGAWPVDLVVVVLGASAEEILAGTDLGSSLVAINPEWEEGIASSIRVGIDVLARDRRFDRALIALGDQPRVPPEVPRALAAAMDAGGRPAAVPVYRYQRGNPVLIERLLWPRLMGLQGDSGAGRLFQAHPDWVEEVRFDCSAPIDIDVVEDLTGLSFEL
jgi:molybdenum cofactor cytidylyltransferase